MSKRNFSLLYEEQNPIDYVRVRQINVRTPGRRLGGGGGSGRYRQEAHEGEGRCKYQGSNLGLTTQSADLLLNA